MSEANRWRAVLLLVAAASAVPHLLVFGTLPIILTNDSVWYAGLTHHFTQFSLPDYYAVGPSRECDVTYPFGYPIFLDLCRILPGSLTWGEKVIATQHVISFLNPVLLLLVARRAGYPKAGTFAALAYALYLPRVIYAQTVMAEAPFTFVMLLAVWLFYVLIGSRTWTVGFLLGIVTGLGIAMKPLAVLSVPFFLAWAVMEGVPLKRLSGLLGAVAVWAAAVICYNVVRYNQPILSGATGRHLANRIFGYDALVDHQDPDTRRLSEICERSGVTYRFPGLWWDFFFASRAEGATAREADDLIKRAALAGLWTAPLKFLQSSCRIFVRNIVGRDEWVDVRSHLSRDTHLAALLRWIEEPAPTLPAAEFQARGELLQAMPGGYPDTAIRPIGLLWIEAFSKQVLEWRGPMGWLIIVSLAASIVIRDRSTLLLSAYIVANLAAIALLEAPYPRYFESYMPLACVVVFAVGAKTLGAVSSLRKPLALSTNDKHLAKGE